MRESIPRIERVRAIQILDSRARPTVSVEISVTGGFRAQASAPSGASTGSAEARELRDRNAEDFAGESVRSAVHNVVELVGPTIKGMDARDQRAIDEAMMSLDGTLNWSRIGGNASIATSLAVCRVAALSCHQPLHQYIRQLSGETECSMPMPMTNIFSGGLHTRQGMDIQDFLCIPNGAESYAEALDWICRVRAAASAVLARRGISTLLADEGGLSPGCDSVAQAFDLMIESFEVARLRPLDQVSIAIDMAATGLLKGENTYRFAREGVTLNSSGIAALLSDCARKYPLLSVEDPCAENDWTGWASVTETLGHLQLIGDDLFATQPDRILRGKAAGAANAVLIKVNQNGSLTGALEAIKAARQVSFRTIISARSGETEDDFIAGLAVGSDAGQIKIGSVRSSERQSKYNRLAWIAADEEDRLPLRNPWARERRKPNAKVV